MITDSSVEFLRAKIKADTFTDAESSSSRNPVVAKIKRVPEHLREGMPGAYQYFDPTLLYLGPFHWGKVIPEESKRLKKKIATVFMKCIGDLDKSTIMCETIYDKFDNLMNFYEPVAGEKEGSSKSKEKQEQQTRTWKEESACMLFEDGCAILYFICRKDQCFIDLSANVPVLIDDDDPRIATDILKLENQIPYEVLTLLMGIAFQGRKTRRNMIDNFITFQISRITRSAQINPGEDVAELETQQSSTSRAAINQDEVSSLAEPDHLLQRLRERFVAILQSIVSASCWVDPKTPAEDVAELEAQRPSQSRAQINQDEDSSSAGPVHLLQHLRERLVGIQQSRAPSRTQSIESRNIYFKASSSKFSSSYNSAATSLKSRNIYFKAVHYNVAS